MRPGAGDTVLCSGTLRTGIPFRERLAAAEAGGFSGISLWGRDYQVARDEGLSDLDIRLLLADHGLSVAELDPCLVVASRVRPRCISRPSSIQSRSSVSASESCSPWPSRGGPLAQRGRRLRGRVVPRRGGGGLRRAVRPRGGPRPARPSGVPAVVEDPRSGDGLAGRPCGRSAQRRHHARRLALLPERSRRRAPPLHSGCVHPRRAAVRRAAAPEPEPLHATLHERLLPGAGELALRTPAGRSRERPARRRRSASRCSPTSCTPWTPKRRAVGRRIAARAARTRGIVAPARVGPQARAR